MNDDQSALGSPKQSPPTPSPTTPETEHRTVKGKSSTSVHTPYIWGEQTTYYIDEIVHQSRTKTKGATWEPYSTSTTTNTEAPPKPTPTSSGDFATHDQETEYQTEGTVLTITRKPKYVTVRSTGSHVDFEKGAVDALFGFDYIDTGSNVIDFGTESLMSSETAKEINRNIFLLFNISDQDGSDQANTIRSLVLTSIFKKFSDDGTSYRANWSTIITINGKDIPFAKIAGLIGRDIRRYARYFATWWYEKLKYQNVGHVPRWGTLHGIPTNVAYLGCDFYYPKMLEDWERPIYNRASAHARRNAPPEAIMDLVDDVPAGERFLSLPNNRLG